MKPKSAERKAQSEQRKQKRKEKSKEAARCRREKECEIFADLIDSLPIADSEKSTMDKTSIIRLVISYIKLRNIVSAEWDANSSRLLSSAAFTDDSFNVLEASHNFVMVLTGHGEIVYVTENVKNRLGMNKSDMIGLALEKFVHPSDWTSAEHEVLRCKSEQIGFTCRMKSTLLPKGRVVHLKSATYKAVRFSGHRFVIDSKDKADMPGSQYLVVTGWPQEHVAEPTFSSIHTDSTTFVSRHDLKMKFTQCDSLVTNLTRFPIKKIARESFYNFVHALDLPAVGAAFETLYTQEHTQTDVYRFMVNGGGYVRMITRASIINDPKTDNRKDIVCVHHVVSQIEDDGLIMSDIQNPVKEEFTDDFSDGSDCASSNDILKPLSEMKVDCMSSPEMCSYDEVIEATASVFQKPCEQEGLNDNNVILETESVFGVPVMTMTESPDVLSTTASMFGDLDCISAAAKPPVIKRGGDILSATARLFDDMSPARQQAGLLTDELPASNNKPTEKTDLESIVADLDFIDMTSGLFADLPPQLTDDEDMVWRAPYIPMDSVGDSSNHMDLDLDADCEALSERSMDNDQGWLIYRSPDPYSSSTAESPSTSGSNTTNASPAACSSLPSPVDADQGHVVQRRPPDRLEHSRTYNASYLATSIRNTDISDWGSLPPENLLAYYHADLSTHHDQRTHYTAGSMSDRSPPHGLNLAAEHPASNCVSPQQSLPAMSHRSDHTFAMAHGCAGQQHSPGSQQQQQFYDYKTLNSGLPTTRTYAKLQTSRKRKTSSSDVTSRMEDRADPPDDFRHHLFSNFDVDQLMALLDSTNSNPFMWNRHGEAPGLGKEDDGCYIEPPNAKRACDMTRNSGNESSGTSKNIPFMMKPHVREFLDPGKHKSGLNPTGIAAQRNGYNAVTKTSAEIPQMPARIPPEKMKDRMMRDDSVKQHTALLLDLLLT